MLSQWNLVAGSQLKSDKLRELRCCQVFPAETLHAKCVIFPRAQPLRIRVPSPRGLAVLWSRSLVVLCPNPARGGLFIDIDIDIEPTTSQNPFPFFRMRRDSKALSILHDLHGIAFQFR
jgi:hypothetical protein